MSASRIRLARLFDRWALRIGKAVLYCQERGYRLRLGPYEITILRVVSPRKTPRNLSSH